MVKVGRKVPTHRSGAAVRRTRGTGRDAHPCRGNGHKITTARLDTRPFHPHRLGMILSKLNHVASSCLLLGSVCRSRSVPGPLTDVDGWYAGFTYALFWGPGDISRLQPI